MEDTIRRVALVTGAAKGIGRAIATRLGDDGYAVGVLDLELDEAQVVADEIRALGGEAIAVACDVRSGEAVRAGVATVVDTFGRLDGAVNNAGLGTPAVDVVDLSEDDWDLVMDVDLKGLWFSLRAEIPHLVESGGSVVNIASILGLVGAEEISPAYVAAKHGVVGLTKCAALQYATRGVRINAICPGTISTPGVEARIARSDSDQRRKLETWQAMERMGTPEEVAEAAAWLLDPRAAFVTGVALPVDGGLTAR